MPLPSMYNQSGFGQPQVNQQQVQGMSLNMPLNFVQHADTNGVVNVTIFKYELEKSKWNTNSIIMAF